MEGRPLKANDLLGLVKFFHEEWKLDALIGGLMHCQTAETYRLSQMEGVSDPAESCAHSWRAERGDPGIELTINGRVMNPDDLVGLTIHNGGARDSWLQCWLSLRLPEDAEALEALKQDLQRMKKNFGRHYAFIANKDVRPFLRQVKAVDNKGMWAQEVNYTDDSSLWSSQCKSLKYAYQREFRLGFGECSVHETEPYVFSHPEGFHHLIHKSPELILKHEEDGTVWLDLGAL